MNQNYPLVYRSVVVTGVLNSFERKREPKPSDTTEGKPVVSPDIVHTSTSMQKLTPERPASADSAAKGTKSNGKESKGTRRVNRHFI